MAYYSSTRSARYPSGYDSRTRGYRICDHCGVEEAGQIQLKLCASCKTTQYCSRTCQKLHWKDHEAICKHTKATIQNSISHYDINDASSALVSSASPPPDLAKHLRKFTSHHARLLGWAGFQALDLKKLSCNIRKYALVFELSWRGHIDPARRFKVERTGLCPLSVLASDPIVCADIQRREDRSRRTGGIGAAVVILQCGSISQVMPVEVDAPAKVPWPMISGWRQHVDAWIDHGCGEFTPPM